MGEEDRAAAGFDLVPADRADAIASAGIEAFARHGYAGALTEDIARGAGISKGLLFFYFKNKRSFYRDLIGYLLDRLDAIVADDRFYRIDDFFELLSYAAHKRKAVFDRFPWILEFSIRAFYPEHREIRDAMNRWNQRQIDWMFERYFRNVRLERFRNEVSPRHVVDMLIWLCDGYMHQQRCREGHVDMDALLTEMQGWCSMLRDYAYKEEYR